MGKPWGEAQFKGLRQIAIRIIAADGTKSDPFFLPGPQDFEPKEDAKTIKTPGGDAYYSIITDVLGGTLKIKWAAMPLASIALLQGSFCSQVGTTPNRQIRLKRRRDDVPVEFELETMVRYIGTDFAAGDYHYVAYRCVMLDVPKVTNKTNEVADCEVEIATLIRADGEFYDMVLNETSIPISTTADNTAVTCTVVPANAATGVLATANVVFTFSKAIQYEPSKFTLSHGVSTLAVTKSIDSTQKIVTLNPTTDFTSAWVVGFNADTILDLAGNSVSASGSFTVA